MAQRTCGLPDCERKHSARGLCAMHWKRQYARYPVDCVSCGVTFSSSRRDGKFCSDSCKGAHYSATMRTHCVLPLDHPVRLLVLAERQAEERAERDYAEQRRVRLAHEVLARRTEWAKPRECPGCGCTFCPLYTPTTVYCSRRCMKRIERRKRRLSDRHIGWVWSEFMRIARKFDYCCAYCGVKPERLDPDHVVPLSRGGADATTNLLPACMLCNSSKNAMTLTEWSAWRAARGQEPRRTTWAVDDGRYTHLTHEIAAA